MRRSQRLIQKAKNETPPILRLNFDCLAEIFSSLTVRERIKLARVCKSWKTIVALWPWNDSKALRIGSFIEINEDKFKYSLPILKKVLGYCSKSITNISFVPEEVFSKSVVSFIGQACPKIEILSLIGLNLSGEAVEALVDNYKNLKYIGFESCYGGSTDALPKLIIANKKLECIEFENVVLDDDCFLNLPVETIKYLLISSDCYMLSLDKTLEFLSKFQNLKEFRVEDSEEFTAILDQVLEAFPNKLNLECLVIKPERKYYMGTSLPQANIHSFANLRLLALMHSDVDDEWLITIGKSCTQLLELYLVSMTTNDRGLIGLTQSLKLEKLDISTPSITDKFFTSVNLSALQCLRCCVLLKLNNESIQNILKSSKNLILLEVVQCVNVNPDILMDDALNYTSNRSNKALLELNITNIDAVPGKRIVSPHLVVKFEKL